MTKIALDKYYTNSTLAEYCVSKTMSVLGFTPVRIIEPSAGSGSFLNYLPSNTLAYDIMPEDNRVTKQDYLELNLPYLDNSLVIGNPPFGRANKLSVKFINKSIEHSEYVSFIQPISQYNNERLANVDLIYSEDLGTLDYSGKHIHCCLNIYKRDIGKKREAYTIPGVYCRHIFRTGSQKHSDKILNTSWDFRIGAWGNISLLNEGEYCTNEVVIKCDTSIKSWLKNELENCDFLSLTSCVSSPNLTAWRLQKYLYEKYKELS